MEDVGKTRRFFEEGLGWKAADFDSDEVAFFDTGGCILGVFGRQALAHDAKVEDDGGQFSASSIARNGDTKDAVDAAFQKAIAAGAEAVKSPETVFWGGYSGYVRIPGGHLMEIAYNPLWPLDEKGHLTLPPPRSD